MKQAYKQIITVLIGAFILMYYALYDNFPILTSDSGSYITSGFSLKAPSDRPIFYGLFILVSSLKASVWLSILCQCMILSYTLVTFIQKFNPLSNRKHIIAILIFISFFTTGGWFASQLMPDIFIPILAISICNYLFFHNNKREQIILLCIIALSVLTHNSNFVILSLCSFLGIFAAIFLKQIRPHLNKIIVLSTISIFSWLLLCTSNFVSGNGFSTSKSTHVFIMGKLVESGVLKIYLEKACPIKDCKICAYKDNLPGVAWAFHWDETSPLQQTGGWEANKREYNTIIADILSRPKYYPLLIYKSLEATARQLTHFEIDGNYILPWVKFEEGTAAYIAIEKYFPHELNQLKYSKQNDKTLYIPFMDNIYLYTILISTMLLLIIRGYSKSDEKTANSIIILFIIIILLNAFSTAVLSSVNARFNARIIWLIPFYNILMIHKLLAHKFSNTKRELKRFEN